MSETPFGRLRHLVTVPVLVDGTHEARFVLDTGIGVTLFSRRLSAAVGCRPNGSTFSGRRMSGQEVTVPLADAPPLAMGDAVRSDHVVGILDIEGDGPGLAAVDGFLSLAFFETMPFTVDYARGVVVVEQPSSLEARARPGAVVPVRVEEDGPAIVAFMQLELPGGATVDVEIDMGSDCLILDERYAEAVGVRLDAADVRRVDGTDETGYEYTRRFATLAGEIHASAAPSVSHQAPEAMFQKIIYDGLVGDAFLRRFTVTYDLPGGRVVFGALD